MGFSGRKGEAPSPWAPAAAAVSMRQRPCGRSGFKFRGKWISRCDQHVSLRSNQSLLKEIDPEYSLQGLMLKLKRQYFGHLMQRADSLEKTLMLGKTEGRRRRGCQRMRWLDSISPTQWTWIWANPGDHEGQGSLACWNPWGWKESHSTEWLNNKQRAGRLFLEWRPYLHGQWVYLDCRVS